MPDSHWSVPGRRRAPLLNAVRICGLCAFLQVLLPGLVSAQQKYAVFVGINDYIEFGDEPGGDLRGAEGDALLMRRVLIDRWGLPESNTRTLLSREATKDAIRESITTFLAERAGPGDLAIFYFAGHGSQAFDLDGDEPDGLDETLAPSDVLKTSTERDIRDDEFRVWLSTIRARVVVILDSCHSGTATRGTGPMRARILNREIPSEGGREPERVRQRYDPESMSDGSITVIEVAAAGPSQSAMEGAFRMDGRDEQGGAFTHYLVKALWEASPTATYDDVIGRVVSSLKADQFIQDPQLEGPRFDPLFAAGRAKSITTPLLGAGAIEVLSVDGRRATLTGTGLSATVGSTYRTDREAVLEIISVSATGAQALVRSGRAEGGDRASATTVALIRPTLGVDTSYLADAPALAARIGAMAVALSERPDIRLSASPDSRPDIYLRPSEDDRFVEVLGRDGGLRTLVPRDDDLARGIVSALDKELSAKRLAALGNPTVPFGIEISITDGGRLLGPGDPIDLRVVPARAGFLTLVDLAPNGALRFLHAHPTTTEPSVRLAAGRPVTVAVAAPDSDDHRAGFGLVLALVTPTPLGLGTASATGDLGTGLVAELRHLLVEATNQDGSASKWASRLFAYHVGSVTGGQQHPGRRVTSR